MMDVQFAKVVKVHPEGHSVDLLMSKDARRMSGVRVLSSSAAGRSGLADLAAPDSQNDADPYAAVNTGKQDVFAMVIFVDGVPFVVGFLFPNLTEMLFSDVNRRIDRHPSDVYVNITDGGDVELAHPSGLYVRISESSGHEDLTGKDWQKKWKIRRNTDKQPHFHVEYPGQWSFDASPQGDVVWKVKSFVINGVDMVTHRHTGVIPGGSDTGGPV